MNNNSRLCCFIAEHPNDWESLLTREYAIGVRKEGNLAIFNYGYGCVFSEPLVQEARGIIIDWKNLEVVCWPFRKFGNYNESYADVIDWQSARVQEKVDGSIIKLWYDYENARWQFSTNGTIRAENAAVENGSYGGLRFSDVIVKADNYADIPFDSLDKDCTYIFELVSPETQIVIKYGEASLYHIGTRNNKTGLECDVDIGIKKPASYPLGSLEECKRAAAALNCGNPESFDDVLAEGFVVVDANWNRVKVKSPDYLVMHRFKQVSVTKKDCIAMLIEGNGDIEMICRTNPDLLPVFKYYEFRLAELKYTADALGELALGLHREYDGDRGAVARIISKHPLSFAAFRCIERGGRGSEHLMRLAPEKLAKLIPDYEAEDLRRLFVGEES